MTVTGKRREDELLICLYDASPAGVILPCACAAPNALHAADECASRRISTSTTWHRQSCPIRAMRISTPIGTMSYLRQRPLCEDLGCDRAGEDRQRTTTTLDHGASQVGMFRCEHSPSNVHPTLVLALRDMRRANGRDPATGEGDGNESWTGLVIGMIVLDTLSGEEPGAGQRFRRLLTSHDVQPADATIIWMLRNSLLHGYGLPKPSDVFGRNVTLTPDRDAYAVDTSRDGAALVSVPVFCARLVERIANKAKDGWDVSRINTDYSYL